MRLDIRRLAGICGASSTCDTRLRGIGVCGVVAVEPQHVDGVVVPQTQDQHHSGLESVTHLLQTTAVLEGIGVAEQGLLRIAVLVRHRVVGFQTGEGGVGVGDNLSVLDVEAADLAERAVGGPVGGDELGDDGEFGVGVDCHSGTVKVRHALAEGVEIATILVANAAVAVVAVAAVVSRASGLTGGRADVGGVGGGDGVGFPEIHLIAAGTVLA